MQKNPKILIVDDERFNVDYLEQELEEFQYEISTAVNGRDALEKVYSEFPDLVLLDIMMPVMDGYEVLSNMKADPVTSEIPVIIISAMNNLQSVVKGIQLGAEDYLPKPFEPVLLHARISSSLEKKRLRDLQQLYLKSLERELDIAREIQMGFLPSELPKLDGWEIDVYFKAAHEVSGDFYDAFLLQDGSLVCVVGDVCGNGVGSALFMTLFRSLIRATSTTDTFHDHRDTTVFTPARRLSHVISFTNKYITETHGDASMFASVFISIINLQDGTLTYMNCGNEPPLLLSKEGAVTVLQPTGPVVGVVSDAAFSVREISMEKNDLLVVFTDGVADALNSDNVSFGFDRLFKSITDVNTPPAMLLKTLKDQLHQFIGKAGQYDDITLLAIKRKVGF